VMKETGEMDTKPKETVEKESPDGMPSNNPHKVRSVYLGDAQWEKMRLIRDHLGNWNRFADVAVEQLLASGLISRDVQDKVYEINRKYGLDYLDNTGWRGSFEIQEPWSKTASNLREINEGVAQLNLNLKDLAQAVEDHAMAMLEAELVKPDESER
jgi:hypothetical protein